MKLHYLLREPKTIHEKNPLLLLLHGYGSNEEDLFSFSSELPEDAYVISARAPFDLAPYGYAWYAIHFDAAENKFSDNEQAKESVHLIANFIDEITNKYAIAMEDITLIGFSQGAILSYATALTYPSKIKNIVALSGYFNSEILPKQIDHSIVKHLNFFASHGTLDQVIPVEWARKTENELAKFGLTITYKEYPIGHGVSPQNFHDFKNWLLHIKK
jgi:phospholipase/carboxylesterase